MRKLQLWTGIVALGLGALGTAWAGDTMETHKTMGQHVMPATVTSVNHKTGLIHVKSDGMKLIVHFPPSTITKVKDGEKIMLHLGYTPE